MCDDLSVLFTVLYIWRWLFTCASVRSLTFISSSTDFGVALSWPPRSSTACTKRAWSAVVHRIRGARALRFDPGRDALAARLNTQPFGCGWLGRPASSPGAGVPSPRLRPGGSAPELGFAKNPTSPLPSSYVAVLGSVGSGFFTAGAPDDAAGGLIWRDRFGRFLCSIGRSSNVQSGLAAGSSMFKWKDSTPSY
uniref:Similar to ATS/KAN4 (ABERRANT TESTA SHAPE) n=1 Tax=Arundo donax TaxID=35708 RepID=A0A0A9F1R4_ARUDO